MNSFSSLMSSPFVGTALVWLNSQPIISSLLILMVFDIITGISAAMATKTLNSSVSWKGMSKKATMLIIVGMAAVLESFSQGVPLAKIVSMFYMTTEGISILENAGLAGVPLPQALSDMLVKLAQPTKPLPARRSEDPK